MVVKHSCSMSRIINVMFDILGVLKFKNSI